MAKQSTDRKQSQSRWIGAGIAATAAVAGTAAFMLARRDRKADEETISDAPRHVLRGGRQQGEDAFVGTTVTIARPRDELYARWRDFTAFPGFMENVERVDDLGDGRSHWTIKGPLGSRVELRTRISEDVPGQRIAWESEPGSDIDAAGRVEFKDIDPVRGTLVRLLMRYDPPGGTAGRLAAKLLRREPEVQARRDLRRFKQLMETGEVSTNASPSGRAGESPIESRV
jgi:uncharacterized membrane protein